jgi:hypothetical protein
MAIPTNDVSREVTKHRAHRPLRRLLCALTLGVAATLSSLAAGAQAPKFYDDDPLWVEPITQDVKNPSRYEPDLLFQSLENLFGKPGDRTLDQRAQNLNTVGEVPDGPYFVNRARHMVLTPSRVATAANLNPPPADGMWEVVAAKSDGVTPGFTVRDRAGVLWFLKFDPPGWRGMATGSEIVAARLFWALGYHTTEYHIAHLRPDRIAIAESARITPPGGTPRRMTRSDIEWLLARADREPDGSYRVMASRAVPGEPVGRIRFHGTRADDPNDLVPHEHRRELRAYLVFSAWLNHVDAKGINSIAALVNENGRTFIRNYLLDFGSTLGSGAIGPREGWQGFEPLVEFPDEIGRRVLTLGLPVPEWRRTDFYEARSIGRMPASHAAWDPETWQPHITNAAFRHARADDKFWAARKLSFITDEMIAAAVAEGRFEDPPAEAFLVRTIAERRDRILERYLPAVNPIVDPALDTSGRLTFANAAVEAGVAPPPGGYLARWFAFDNATGKTTAVGETAAAASPLPVPALPAGEFVKVEISATGAPHPTWEVQVDAYFRRTDAGWRLVGFERLP